MHWYIYTYTHTYIHTHIHTYIHTYIHTHIHTYTHIHIHTYMHTYILAASITVCGLCVEREPHNRHVGQESVPNWKSGFVFICQQNRWTTASIVCHALETSQSSWRHAMYSGQVRAALPPMGHRISALFISHTDDICEVISTVNYSVFRVIAAETFPLYGRTPHLKRMTFLTTLYHVLRI
jgi:hypothetical protein